MTMIGPISPQVPYAKMDLPMRVPTRPRSCRMGTSVPNAVVVRAIAAASHPIWFDWKSGVAMQIYHRDSQSDKPSKQSMTTLPARQFLRVYLITCEEKQEAETEVGDKRDCRIGLRNGKHVGTD